MRHDVRYESVPRKVVRIWRAQTGLTRVWVGLCIVIVGYYYYYALVAGVLHRIYGDDAAAYIDPWFDVSLVGVTIFAPWLALMLCVFPIHLPADPPVCAKCRYHIVQSSPSHALCPECGSDLTQKGAVLDMVPLRRWLVALVLLLLIIPPLLALLAPWSWSQSELQSVFRALKLLAIQFITTAVVVGFIFYRHGRAIKSKHVTCREQSSETRATGARR